MNKVLVYEDGLVIKGLWPDVKHIVEKWQEEQGEKCPLIVADPPYGNIVSKKWDAYDKAKELAAQQIQQAIHLESLCYDNSAMYWFGGYGKPRYRPFWIFCVGLEMHSRWRVSMPITWGKKRAYGTQNNYLATREEIVYCTLGDIKKPRCFNVPYLTEKRGYKGYNKKYPAKSDYKRRTAVWTDVTEILRGKIHICQKPTDLIKIPIEVHTQPGEHVIDPFAGSGTTAVAARELGRKFVLVEADHEGEGYIEKIKSRLGPPIKEI